LIHLAAAVARDLPALLEGHQLVMAARALPLALQVNEFFTLVVVAAEVLLFTIILPV
jgi:hypothetical protein